MFLQIIFESFPKSSVKISSVKIKRQNQVSKSIVSKSSVKIKNQASKSAAPHPLKYHQMSHKYCFVAILNKAFCESENKHFSSVFASGLLSLSFQGLVIRMSEANINTKSKKARLFSILMLFGH